MRDSWRPDHASKRMRPVVSGQLGGGWVACRSRLVPGVRCAGRNSRRLVPDLDDSTRRWRHQARHARIGVCAVTHVRQSRSSGEDPTITVIMPAHDAEAYVGAAIASILGQTCSDFELIIVNDRSRDGTATEIERAVGGDPRVRVLESSAGNVSAARNLGLAVARGRFIALMDADDVAYPHRLQRQLDAAARDPDVVGWGAYLQCMTADGRLMQTIRDGCRTREEFRQLDRTTNLVQCHGTIAFFRRDVMERVGGFDPRLDVAEDSELWDRMCEYGPWLVVPETLQYYRQHEGSLSVRRIGTEGKWHRYIMRRYARRLEGKSLSVEAYELEETAKRRLLWPAGALTAMSKLYARRFHIAMARGRFVEATRMLILSFVTDPARLMKEAIDELHAASRRS